MISFSSFCTQLSDSGKTLFESPAWKTAKTKLDAFEIEGVTSNLPMAVTFKLVHKTSKTPATMRVMRKWLTCSSKAYYANYQRFFFNYQNKGKMFLQINCVVETPAFLAIVTDFLPYGSLFDYINPTFPDKRRTIDESSLTFFASKLLDILEEVHNDHKILFALKPEDILIVSPNEFVISHITYSKLSLKDLSDHTILDAPEYLPPEVIMERPMVQASDFWQLGILLYECLTGITPFQQSAGSETMNAIVKSPLYFPPKSLQNISQECQDFIQTLLEKDETKRARLTAPQLREHPFMRSIQKESVFVLDDFVPEPMLPLKGKMIDKIALRELKD